MKKTVALVLFCSATFSMGMKKSVDDVSSKLKTKYKEFRENFCDPSYELDESGEVACKLIFSGFVFEKTIDENFKNNSFYKEICKEICGEEDLDLFVSDPDYKELYADLDFVSSNPISNKDYKNLDTILKFVSSQSESIYKELQAKKEEYSKLNPPKGYSRYHSAIRNFGEFAISWSLTSGAFRLYTKSFGEIKTMGDAIKKLLLLPGMVIINTKVCNKIFNPYTRRCKTYAEKKKEKEDYEDMKSFARGICDLAKRRSSLKPIFQNSIREKEKDKLSLLDVEIKTLH